MAFPLAALLSPLTERNRTLFGLDTKSVIVGILIAWFVLPMVMGAFAKVTNKAA